MFHRRDEDERIFVFRAKVIKRNDGKLFTCPHLTVISEACPWQIGIYPTNHLAIRPCTKQNHFLGSMACKFIANGLALRHLRFRVFAPSRHFTGKVHNQPLTKKLPRQVIAQMAVNVPDDIREGIGCSVLFCSVLFCSLLFPSFFWFVRATISQHPEAKSGVRLHAMMIANACGFFLPAVK